MASADAPLPPLPRPALVPCTAAAPPSAAAVTAAVTLAYGVALTINSLASGPTSLSAMILLNSIGRVLGAAACAALLAGWAAAAPTRARTSATPPTPPLPALVVLDRRALLPLAVAAAGTCGYLAYYELMRGAGGRLGVWPAAVGLYTCLPVLWGLCARRERATPRKVAGVACALAAVAVLGLSGQAEAPVSGGASAGTGPAAAAGPGPLQQAALYATVVAVWGCGDIMSAEITASREVVLLATAVGHTATAALAGLALLIWPPPPAPFALPQLLLLVGNAVALIGWLGYVYLGSLKGAAMSTFVPLISLYAFVPALVGIVALGEALTPLRAVGLVLAVAAALAVATAEHGAAAPQPRPPSPPPPPPPPPLQPQPQLQLPLLPPAVSGAGASAEPPAIVAEAAASAWSAGGAVHSSLP